MPIDEASIAQAAKPASANNRSAACSITGSGVVSPVNSICAARSGSGGAPIPSVPTTAQRRPSSVSACAVHHDVDVLPLVPVVAMISSERLGCSKNASAIAPVAAFRPGNEAMRASSKAKTSSPSRSTRQVVAPAASALATKRRPSVAAPGQAMNPSPARTLRLSVVMVPVTHARSQRAAASGDLSAVMVTARSSLAPRS